MQGGDALAIQVGELVVPLPLIVQQLVRRIGDLRRQQRDAILAQHAQAHGERFAVELLLHLRLKAPGRCLLDFLGNAQHLGEAPLLGVGRERPGLTGQVLDEQHGGRLQHTGSGKWIGAGAGGEVVGLVTGQRQVEHRHLRRLSGRHDSNFIALMQAPNTWRSSCRNSRAAQPLARRSVSLGSSLNKCL